MFRSWAGIVWVLVVAVAAALAIQAVVTLNASGVPTAVGLRLNEILAGPARDWDGDTVYDARGDEWIELANTGSTPVPLDAYRLADADRTVRFALSGNLEPGALRLVLGSQALAWQRAQGLTTSGLSLNNSGDTVYLMRIEGSDTTVTDSHAYGSIEAGSDRSVGLAHSDGDDWILFDALNRYTGGGTPAGTGCSPTPGGANGCTTDVESSTWGAIKRIYR